MNEPEDVIDSISDVAKAIRVVAKDLGLGNAGTEMGAIEFHAVTIKEAAEAIASAIRDLAQAISDHE